MNRIFRNTIFYLLIFLVVIGVVSFFNNPNPKEEPITYNTFIQKLESSEVEKFTIQPTRSVYEARGTLVGAKEGESFVAIFPNSASALERVENVSDEQDIPMTVKEAEETSGWVTFFTSIIPFVIIFILFFFLLNQAQGGGSRVMNFGKSKAKLYSEEKKKVKFKDVAGADEEKQELVEVVEFLKDHANSLSLVLAFQKEFCLLDLLVLVKPCLQER